MKVSPTGLLDDQVIEDAHHPNLKGYVALAGAVLRELQRRKALGEDLNVALPLDLAGCWNDFQMDSARLATACERTSVHYQRVSGYRYDPDERMSKSRRFAEAAEGSGQGAAPDDVGLPWVVPGLPSDSERDPAVREGGMSPVATEIPLAGHGSWICSTCQSSRSTVAPRPRNRTMATNWSRLPRRITVPSIPVSGPVMILTLDPTGAVGSGSTRSPELSIVWICWRSRSMEAWSPTSSTATRRFPRRAASRSL